MENKIKVSVFKSKILNIESLSKEVKSLRLSVPSGFRFKAGQCLSLSVFDSQGRKIRRPLSIVNAPSSNGKDEFIEFCAKMVPGGLASEYIKILNKGDEVELFGPAGKFVVDVGGKDKEKDLFFIAAGVGIAPFVGIIEDLLNNRNFRKKIILLKSSRTEESSLYDKEFLALFKKYFNFEFHNIFSRPKNSEWKDVGHVQDFLDKYIPSGFSGNFYVCGLREMISETKEKLKKLGFGEKQIFEEKFD